MAERRNQVDSNKQKVLIVGEHREGRKPPYMRVLDSVEDAERLVNGSRRIRGSLGVNGHTSERGYEFYREDGTSLRVEVEPEGPARLEPHQQVGELAVLVRAAAALGEVGARVQDEAFAKGRELMAPMVELGLFAQLGYSLSGYAQFFEELSQRIDEMRRRFGVTDSSGSKHETTKASPLGPDRPEQPQDWCEYFCVCCD
jgi:hypothetical protein